MDKKISIAIIVIVALLAIFIISFVAYKKTPEPKGSEKFKCDKKTCEGCPNEACLYKQDTIEESDNSDRDENITKDESKDEK